MKRLVFALLLVPALASAQAFRVGTGIQIKPKASRPTTATGNGTLWSDSTAGNALKYTTPAGVTSTLSTATGYATIDDEGTPLTQRTILNFIGAGVSCVDNAGATRTDCTISSGGSSTLAGLYAAGANQTDSTLLLDSTRLGVRIRDNGTPITGDLLAVQDSAGTKTMLGVRATGASITSTVQTSGAPSPLLLLTPVAHTGLTASTEYHHLNVASTAVTTQWATGAMTQQRFNRFQQPTIAFVGASTVDDAANVHIAGAPSAGTNATLTHSWSLWIGSGESLLQRDTVGTTVGAAALTLENRSAATVGAQKYSPALIWSGRGWQTTGPASETVQVAAQLVPIQGTTHPTQQLVFYESINGGGWAQTEINGAGYFGSNDQAALGTATTSSTTFVDVGNGSSTGFTSWTAPTTKVTKTYRMTVVVRAYMPTIAASAVTWFQVLQDGAAISGQPTYTASQVYGGTSQWLQTTWRISVPQTAGTAHVYKLQWKVGSGSDVAGVTTSVGTLQFFIEG